jgi:hypothetical protein
LVREIVLVVVAAAVASCGGNSTCSSRTIPTAFKPGVSVDFAISCGADLPPCPGDDLCGIVYLDTGAKGPACLPSNVCDLLDCGPHRCGVAESYPAHIGCGPRLDENVCQAETGVRADGGRASD